MKQKKLKEICKLIVDCEHKTAPTQETGYPSIRTPNVGRGRLLLDGVNRVSEETYRRWSQRAVPQADDIILAREAPLGNAAIIPPGLKVCLGQRTVLIRPDVEQVEPQYLVYLLLGDDIQGKFHSYGAGATVPHLNMSDIRNLPLPKLPSMETQRRIAAILSAYDDLIENNTQRIKLLERAAHDLYREWFVYFRFPGHESVRMVDSGTEYGEIPEGWKLKQIEECCVALSDGDWIESKDQGGSDYRLAQVSNIGVGEFIETNNFRYISEDTFDRLRCHEVIPGDILVSRMPKPTGRAWLVNRMPWNMVTVVDVAIIKADRKQVEPVFLVYLMNSSQHLDLVEKHSTGTTRPRISRRDLSALSIVVPPLELQKVFSHVAGESYELATVLRNSKMILRETRDLLLPRLVSGEVDVSKLDFEFSVDRYL